ncbi:MAG: bifunctional 2-polyprenyl-6-hydroxyphenol methylase/3-demethylubiquinol 3-O-methyltransferase UbiG [Candidatus Aminicenantales bacterium]
MRNVSQKAYDRIDNDIYSTRSGSWWDPESDFYQMKVAFNPVRVGYARRILFDELKIDPRGKLALEVGSGGGYLSEEIAGMGFAVTGIDPSGNSLEAAAGHARATGLEIIYAAGTGEGIPFRDRSFDAVFCCDVLEHVHDLPKVISEISRVLKPGGVFVFDTLNRTWLSKLLAIKISQQWKRWAFMPPDLHVWEMFIKPRELRALLERHQLEWKEHRGIMPSASPFKTLRFLRKRAKGEWTYRDLSARVRMAESRCPAVMYMGHAVKKAG